MLDIYISAMKLTSAVFSSTHRAIYEARARSLRPSMLTFYYLFLNGHHHFSFSCWSFRSIPAVSVHLHSIAILMMLTTILNEGYMHLSLISYYITTSRNAQVTILWRMLNPWGKSIQFRCRELREFPYRSHPNPDLGVFIRISMRSRQRPAQQEQ